MPFYRHIPGFGSLVVNVRRFGGLEAFIIPEAWLRACYKGPYAYGYGTEQERAEAFNNSESTQNMVTGDTPLHLPAEIEERLRSFSGERNGIICHWKREDEIALAVSAPDAPENQGLEADGEWLVQSLT